ncbi:CoA transferase [Streptomyces sp. NPDC004031]
MTAPLGAGKEGAAPLAAGTTRGATTGPASATDPAATEPAATTDPATTDPATTGPAATTDPATTEPAATTDPATRGLAATTDPAATEPAATTGRAATGVGHLAAGHLAVPAPGRGAPAGRAPGRGTARSLHPAGAVRLAADHLRAAGCRVGPVADGAITAEVVGGGVVRCEVSWAGPVGVTLGTEADVQAACGLTHVHGRRYGRPTPLGVDYATCLAGALAAAGTLAALVAGRGGPSRATTSVAQAALLAAGQYIAAATAADDDGHEPGGTCPPGAQGGPDRPDAPSAPPFVSADGLRFELETLDAEVWRDFWAALGADRAAAARGWLPFQQRYATAVCPLPPALHEATARRGLAELQRHALATRMDLTPVAAGPHPGAGGGRAPWQLRPAGRPVTPATAATTATATGDADALPLAGVTVVEVCRRVQGPLAGHLLRLLGARVLRVEPPGGDPMRGMPPVVDGCSARFTALNRGKDVLEADLGTASGRAAVREVARTADVFLHSLAPGKDVRLGLDAEALIAASPALVHAAASGWGDARGHHPPTGTDFPVQAWSGLAALVTPPGLPPTPSLLTLTDVLGGVVCAEGALAGLLAARLTGRGQAVTSSLLSAARLLCGPEFRSADAPASVPVRTDLAGLAADPRFAPALDRGPCALTRSPWEFHR